MKKSIKVLTLVMLMLFSTQAHAFFSPVAVSIIPPVQFPPSEFTVTGVRASVLWGHHRDLYGLDFGLLGNITEISFVGAAVSGIFNVTHGMTTIIGLQAAGLANFNTQKTTVLGLQLALGINSNEAESSVTGVQAALFANLSAHTNIYGLQMGIYNKAQDVYGLQVGIVNVASNLHGLQIGLVNFNEKGLFAVSPILNAGF
jgi:hypothetical protein